MSPELLVRESQLAETSRQRALEWVNDIRAGHGLQPLDDFPPDNAPTEGFSRVETCPVAQALVYYKVGGTMYTHKDRCLELDTWLPLPSYVREIISRFDAEKDLDED